MSGLSELIGARFDIRISEPWEFRNEEDENLMSVTVYDASMWQDRPHLFANCRPFHLFCSSEVDSIIIMPRYIDVMTIRSGVDVNIYYYKSGSKCTAERFTGFNIADMAGMIGSVE